MSLQFLLPTLSVLAVGVVAQGAMQATSWSVNASVPQTNPSTSGCMIFAQITSPDKDPVIQALHPICPTGTPHASDPSTGVKIEWPLKKLADDIEGAPGQLVLYGNVAHKEDRTDVYMAQAGCVMPLSEDQVSYILGRSLTWNNNLQQLWDNTGNGFVMGGLDSGAITCGANDKLLPKALYLPDPYAIAADNAAWSQPINLKVLQVTPLPSGVAALPVVEAPSSSASASSSSAAAAVPAPSPSPSPSPSASSSSTGGAAITVTVGNNPPIGGALIGVSSGAAEACSTVTVKEIFTTTATVTATASVKEEKRGRYQPRGTKAAVTPWW